MLFHSSRLSQAAWHSTPCGTGPHRPATPCGGRRVSSSAHAHPHPTGSGANASSQPTICHGRQQSPVCCRSRGSTAHCFDRQQRSPLTQHTQPRTRHGTQMTTFDRAPTGTSGRFTKSQVYIGFMTQWKSRDSSWASA